MCLGVDVGIAPETLQHAPDTLAQHPDLPFGEGEVVRGHVVGLLARELAFLQRLLSRKLPGEEPDPLLLRRDLGHRFVVVGAKLLDLRAHQPQLRIGALERDLERLLIQPEQDLSLANEGVVVDPDPFDPPGHVGADRDDVRLDVGVLGGDVSPAFRVDVDADRDRDQRHHHQQHRTQRKAADPSGDS